MTWLRLDDGIYDHPKTVAAGDEAFGAWVRIAAWCAKHLTDGKVPGPVLDQLLPTGELRDRLFSADVALLERRADGAVWVHDFLVYNPSRADVEANREADRERKRTARAARRHADPHGGVRPDSERSPTDPPGLSARIPGRVYKGSVLGGGAGGGLPEIPSHLLVPWSELVAAYPAHRVDDASAVLAFLAVCGDDDQAGLAVVTAARLWGVHWQREPRFVPNLSKWLRDGWWKRRPSRDRSDPARAEVPAYKPPPTPVRVSTADKTLAGALTERIGRAVPSEPNAGDVEARRSLLRRQASGSKT